MGLRLPAALVAAIICAVLAVCVTLAVPGATAKPRPRPHPPRVTHPLAPVVAENARPGTTGWYGLEATGRAAEVYASATDVTAGAPFDVHVSTAPAAPYRVVVYRLGWYGGVGARQVACSPACDGANAGTAQSAPEPDADGRIVAGWPTTDTIATAASWPSGVYLIRALLLGGPQRGASATTYVVVTSAQRAPSHMLVQVPVNTWQAYNMWGGKSLYPFAVDGRRAIRVSYDRPYDWHGRGGQSPLGWELPLIRFIERSGFDVSYQSDVRTDADPASLLGHRVLVDSGHDEYWSARMRDGWDAARAAGVNLAFMGANDAYWQVKLEDEGRTVMSYKGPEDPNPDRRAKTMLFRALEPERRECDLMGIQHQGGDLGWSDGDYTVERDALDDPWFRRTGFKAGDSVRGIVSREVDSVPTGMSADYSCGNKLTVLFHRELGGEGHGNADAVRIDTERGSAIFASGSLNFAWGLDDFVADGPQRELADARLQTFTRNMLTSMGAY